MIDGLFELPVTPETCERNHLAVAAAPVIVGEAGPGPTLSAAGTSLLIASQRFCPAVSRDIRKCPVAVMRGARWWPSDLPRDGHQTCPAG